MSLRDDVCAIAFAHYGLPYIWGGDDPILGEDCSGFAQEPFRAVGLLPRAQDFNADGLLNVAWKNLPRIKEQRLLRPGDVVFWARPDKTIRHVEIVWRAYPDRVLTIGARGGGPKTRTREDAIRDNAFVKVSPLDLEWECAIDPFPNPF